MKGVIILPIISLQITLACSMGVHPALEDHLVPGYYVFDSKSYRFPPSVPRPPYTQTARPCPGVVRFHPRDQLRLNLCGDLQRKQIPLSPMSENRFNQLQYPFDIIRTKSMELFKSLLPVLKADSTLPRVASLKPATQSKPGDEGILPQHESVQLYQNSSVERAHVSGESETTRAKRYSRAAPVSVSSSSGWTEPQVTGIRTTDETKSQHANNIQHGVPCPYSWTVLCSLFYGWSSPTEAENGEQSPDSITDQADSSEPHTPCPSIVEYVTPVYAKNYEGVWRYVVQIPHEGFFTQTVEVTNCRDHQCHMLTGSCLSSPRWVSLLVAEMFYPLNSYPLKSEDHKRSEPNSAYHRITQENHNVRCDGTDEFGCYQIRLYYDWFLVPGDCKCWRQNLFSQYTTSASNAQSETTH